MKCSHCGTETEYKVMRSDDAGNYYCPECFDDLTAELRYDEEPDPEDYNEDQEREGRYPEM